MPDSTLLATLKTDYGKYIIDGTDTSDDFPCVEVEPHNIAAFCSELKHDTNLQFNFLSDICGIDYLPQIPRFVVVYHLYSITNKIRVRIKCKLAEDAEIPSVTSVWKTANWHEREAFDMYGIVFTEHPDLRRIYMWDEFEGYPQRKDFPLRGYCDEYNPFGDPPESRQEKEQDQGWSH